MARISLVVLCVALVAILPCRARDCLTHCCNTTEVEHAGRQLTSRVEGPKVMPPSYGCEASSKGDVRKRSISPWRYEKDEDSTRFPFRLWQARCSCTRCIVLNPPLAAGKQRNETTPFGNSAIVSYRTVVFFRRQCGAEPRQFTLVPELYTVNVSCTCVIPQKHS